MASKAKIKKLDRIFSKYIRERDRDGDHFVCCSCGEMKPFEQADAGHFINRRWMMVRWDERNVHAQCRSCNRFDEGNGAGYTRFMMRNYGDPVIDILEASKTPYTWKDWELDILIEEYQQKYNDLKKST